MAGDRVKTAAFAKVYLTIRDSVRAGSAETRMEVEGIGGRERQSGLSHENRRRDEGDETGQTHSYRWWMSALGLEGMWRMEMRSRLAT